MINYCCTITIIVFFFFRLNIYVLIILMLPSIKVSLYGTQHVLNIVDGGVENVRKIVLLTCY